MLETDSYSYTINPTLQKESKDEKANRLSPAGFSDRLKKEAVNIKSFSVINLTPEQMKELGEAAQMPGIKFPW